jgi:hypothetical protein
MLFSLVAETSGWLAVQPGPTVRAHCGLPLCPREDEETDALSPDHCVIGNSQNGCQSVSLQLHEET